MPSTTSAAARPAFDKPLAPFLDHPDLPLPGLLSSTEVEQTFERHGVHFGTAHNSIFTPVLTAWAWLSQVVFADKSTAAACARVSVLLLALVDGLGPEQIGRRLGVTAEVVRQRKSRALRRLGELLKDPSQTQPRGPHKDRK